nr:hypothetical protein CFP56_67398 [Quercus suber]
MDQNVRGRAASEASSNGVDTLESGTWRTRSWLRTSNCGPMIEKSDGEDVYMNKRFAKVGVQSDASTMNASVLRLPPSLLHSQCRWKTRL